MPGSHKAQYLQPQSLDGTNEEVPFTASIDDNGRNDVEVAYHTFKMMHFISLMTNVALKNDDFGAIRSASAASRPAPSTQVTDNTLNMMSFVL